MSGATQYTLPFLTFIGSLVISLFVPSGGGHWAVQGPIAVGSALAIGQRSPAYLGLISMAVAVGEGVANMIQPFWLLPLLAIAKLNVRQVMGFTIVAFVIGFRRAGSALEWRPASNYVGRDQSGRTQHHRAQTLPTGHPDLTSLIEA